MENLETNGVRVCQFPGQESDGIKLLFRESHRNLYYVWYVNYCWCRSKDKIKNTQIMFENTPKEVLFWQFSKVAANLKVMEN